MKKIENLLKHNKFFQKIYVLTFSLFFKFLGLFIRPRNYILFQSLIGKNFGESPKAIFDKIVDDPFFAKYQMVWAFDDPSKFPFCPCKKVKLNSLKYFIYALKSSIWISNAGIERGLRFKHRKTIHINTDHGFAYKHIGNDQSNRNDYNFKTVDLFCCCSEFDRKIKIRGYKIKENSAVVCGYPVNDVFYNVNQETIKKLRKKYNVPEDKKVILYAPTWRDNFYESIYKDFEPINFELWKKELGSDYILFVRGHHLSDGKNEVKYDSFVRDGASNIPMEEMVVLADILVSDYSAIMFNYSILEKPIIAYVYDNEEYQKVRGTYLNPFDVFKGSSFTDERQVIDFIKSMNYMEECNKTKAIKDIYMVGDGTATKFCIDYLKERLTHGTK